MALGNLRIEVKRMKEKENGGSPFALSFVPKALNSAAREDLRPLAALFINVQNLRSPPNILR